MSKLLVKSNEIPDENGMVLQITPESAGWKYVGFEVYKLKKGDTLKKETCNYELGAVLLSGKANAMTKNKSWKSIGKRMSVFEKTPAYTVYVSNNDFLEIEALTNLELAICVAPGKGTYESRLIKPSQVHVSTRGGGRMEREIHGILPEEENADSLFIIEVFTPEGNWSSYPPHKHDHDNYPTETYLEETYYHKIKPSEGGFAIQRVYTDDRSLNEIMVVHDGDSVMVPEGHHPCSAPPGYELYYLNVMAGPIRKWRFTNDSDHDWLVE